jgi:AcrR family transcriptional regulator
MNETKENILKVATTLFYRKGFTNTGVEEIINLSNCKKPTLYYHFDSKFDLGNYYLDFKENELIKILEHFDNKSKTTKQFFTLWILFIKRAIKEKKFYGCPFTAFTFQLSQEDKLYFEEKLHKIKRNWLNKVKLIFEKKRKYSRSSLEQLAMETMIVYVGAGSMYRMTNEKEFLEVLEKQFFQIAVRV